MGSSKVFCETRRSKAGKLKYALNETVPMTPQPGMSAMPEISEDGKTYTFRIRDNAKWSNERSAHCARLLVVVAADAASRDGQQIRLSAPLHRRGQGIQPGHREGRGCRRSGTGRSPRPAAAISTRHDRPRHAQIHSQAPRAGDSRECRRRSEVADQLCLEGGNGSMSSMRPASLRHFAKDPTAARKAAASMTPPAPAAGPARQVLARPARFRKDGWRAGRG